MPVKVLAVASGGGHWEQLMLMRAALDGFDTRYATTDASLAERDGLPHAQILPDCNRNNKTSTLRALQRAFAIVRAFRPDVVISTGALPGLLCLIAGRLSGARTLWVDSVANCDRLSGSGRIAQLVADRCVTQWEHLAIADPRLVYAGSLL